MDCNELCIEGDGVSLKMNISENHKSEYESVTVQQCFDFCSDKEVNYYSFI